MGLSKDSVNSVGVCIMASILEGCLLALPATYRPDILVGGFERRMTNPLDRFDPPDIYPQCDCEKPEHGFNRQTGVSWCRGCDTVWDVEGRVIPPPPPRQIPPHTPGPVAVSSETLDLCREVMEDIETRRGEDFDVDEWAGRIAHEVVS